MQAIAGGVWPSVPGAPTSVSATAGNASATVTFTAPSYTGYPAGITGYKATSTPGSFTATGSSSPLTVTGLTNGTSYTLAVQALNAAGYGPAGTSGSVTPVNPYFMGVIKPSSGSLYSPQLLAQGAATNASNMYFVAGGTSLGGGLFNITTGGSLAINQFQTVSGQSVYFDAITVASSGNIYACGYYNGGACWIVKFNSGGSVVWATNTPNLTYDTVGVVTDSSENIYVSGKYQSGETYGDSNSRYMLAKFDSSGATQWQKQYGSGVDGYRSGTVAQYGSLVYGVCSYQDSSYSRYGTLVILNASDGSISSQTKFPANAFFNNIVASPSTGNLYISGQSVNNRSLLIKTDSSGALQWGQQLNSGYTNTAVAIDSSENAYVLVKNSSANDYTMLLAKYNSSGTIQWQRDITMPSTYITQSNGSISCNISGGVCVSFQVGDGTNYYPFVALFPTSGSGSGSYTFNGGTFTYGASSISNTSDSSTFTTASNGLATLTRTVSSNSPSVASAGASLLKATVV
jgi:hypothetical protein